MIDYALYYFRYPVCRVCPFLKNQRTQFIVLEKEKKTKRKPGKIREKKMVVICGDSSVEFFKLFSFFLKSFNFKSYIVDTVS